MAKRRITYPGSIYARNGYVYISFRGKRISTGLRDTQHARRVAQSMLEKFWHESREVAQSEYQKPMTTGQAFREFLSTKISRYPKTLRQYRTAYDTIITGDYLLKIGSIERDVQNYIGTTAHSAVTINTYLTLLQIYLNYCSEQGWLPVRNLKKIYKKKEKPVRPEPYTDEECMLILGYLNKRNPELAMMIEFMLETGARVVDCLTLTREQIRDTSIIWQNKITKKPEERPVSDRALEILRQLPERDDRVFRWSYATSSRLHTWLRKTFKVCGISPGRSFQEFRITFRMRMIKRRMPEIYIEYLLRHAKPEVTALHYTGYKSDDIRKHLNE